jgi:surface antigen
MSAGGRKFNALSAAIAVTMAFAGGQAAAHGTKHIHRTGHASYTGKVRYHRSLSTRVAYHQHHHIAGYAFVYGARVIQCVTFARQDAGIDLAGNARDWWSNAAGVYERGSRPEPGSVLSFRANGRMPLGHVAVVAGVGDSRTIMIDQSHWNSRGITRDIEVKDVSENNDWSAVRVQLGRGGAFGSIYPTHGFIYPRPDRGMLVANTNRAPMPVLGQAPADLRSRLERVPQHNLELAEMPETGKPLDLRLGGISFDAPNRSLQ